MAAPVLDSVQFRLQALTKLPDLKMLDYAELDKTILRPSAETVQGKDDQVRTFDLDGFRRRAGCVCFRTTEEREVLLISSSGTPDRWVLPGGGIEPKESPSECALREALEEAGAEGTIRRFVGIYEEKMPRRRTAVFVVHTTSLNPDWVDRTHIARKRRWFSLEQAYHELGNHRVLQQQCLLDSIMSGPHQHLPMSGINSQTATH